MINLKESLDSGRPLIGTFSTSGSPVMVETVGYAGLDFVVLDCEHATVSPYGGELAALIRAARSAGISPIVRVTWNDPGQIMKALDMGASAVVVPHVNGADEATGAVLAAHHHPKGRRSATPAVMGSQQGLIGWPAHYGRSQDDTIVVPLIEEAAGVDHIEEIAAVPNLGGIFFGPFDLAVSLGAGEDARDADVSAARARVYAAAKANGLPIFDLAWSVEAALALIRKGAQAVAVGVDISMFADSCRQLAVESADAKRRAAGTRRRPRSVAAADRKSGG